MALKTTILLLILINYSECSFNDELKLTVEKLRAKAKEKYGDVKRDVDLRDLNDEQLLYPKQDKTKLSLLSQQWLEYYECTVRSIENLTKSGTMPSRFVVSYVGSYAELPCGLCVAPDERNLINWWIAESLQNLTFIPFYKETSVLEQDGTIKLDFVREEDRAVYRCQIGDSASGLVVLEVVEEHDYNVVKPRTSSGPYPAPSQTIGDLKVYTLWGRWSQCSACDKVGRKRRFGVCFVSLGDLQNLNIKPKNGTTLDEKTRTLFNAFPNGIPCRSSYLPVNRTLDFIQNRPNEIMIAMCKVPCQSHYIDVTSLFENNSVVSQAFQVQPSEPVRDIVFAVRGKSLVVTCPGTSIADIPVTWRVGSKRVVPAHLYNASEGRVRVNARDQLVFTTLVSGDTNLYSCWQSAILAGTVKLEVWSGGYIQWNIHLVLLFLCIVCAILLRMAVRLLHRQKRRLGIA